MLGDGVMENEFWRPRQDLKQQFYERLQDMGATELGLSCIETFFNLDAASHYAPEKVLLGEVAYVVEIGLVLSILGIDSLSREYLGKVSEAVSAGRRISPDFWSELLVAALLKYYGAAVRFVPRATSRTSDLHASWKGREEVDVEVTRAELRQLHQAVRAGIEDFVQALSPGDVNWHVACFVSDASNPKILSAAFGAAVKLTPGQFAEDPGVWFTRAVPLDERDTVVGGNSNELLGPIWWPKGESTFFSNSTLLNGRGNPVVMLRSLAPETSYLNPIMRKAEHGQHTDGKPYVIALNASELPSANERLKSDIEKNFPLWQHVSGILIFSPWFYISSKTKAYKFRVLKNPHATHSMPRRLVELSDKPAHDLEFTICQK